MADEKKPGGAGGASGKPSGGKSAAPAAKKSDSATDIFGVLLMMLVAVYLLNGFVSMLAGNGFISKAYQSVFPNASSTSPRPFSEEGILLSHSRPIASLLNPIGVSVVALGDTNSSDTAVFDSPGGKQIGTQSIDARGKITQGPVNVGGQNYYFVQFASGKSGWVLEGDIGAVMSQPTPFEN